MSLKSILAGKCGRIICIEPSADIAAAAKLLSAHHIGALVVRGAEGEVVGMLSERDIVRTMADVGSAGLQAPVAQIMTRNVSTCDVNDSISSLMERMTEGKFRHMPVFDQDRLVGLVSIGDVLKLHIDTQHGQIRHLEGLIGELQLMRL